MNLVCESLEELLFEKFTGKVEVSAGIVIIQNNKILLVHPTNASWYKSYSIPKGGLIRNENIFKAAKRETLEEIGVKIKSKNIISKKPIKILYTDNGIIHKIVYYFIAKPSKEIIINKHNLQQKEVDWAGFIDKNEAKKRINPRMKEILRHLK